MTKILQSLQSYNHLPKYRRINRLMWFYAVCRAKYITLADLQQTARKIPNQNIEENEMLTLLERTKLEGKEEGIQEGKAEGKIDAVVLILSSRFGFIPQQIEERLNAIDPEDILRLNDLLLLASQCKSFDEFERASKMQ